MRYIEPERSLFVDCKCNAVPGDSGVCGTVVKGEGKVGDIGSGVFGQAKMRCNRDVRNKPNISYMFGELVGQPVACLTNIEFIVK